MSLPKRLELWVLLAVIVAGIILVFATRQRDEDPAAAAGGAASVSPPGDTPMQLHRSVLTRDYGNARLDIEVRVGNPAGEKLVLQSPTARLLTAVGREIPGFFLPFEQLPEVPAGTTQDVQLRYWLEAADLKEALSLEVGGKRIEVKTAKPFDLANLKNGEKTTIAAGEW